jgi:hypothetical protein
MFKLIPLLCTHVYSYMFSTMHPLSYWEGEEVITEVACAICCAIANFMKHQVRMSTKQFLTDDAGLDKTNNMCKQLVPREGERFIAHKCTSYLSDMNLTLRFVADSSQITWTRQSPGLWSFIPVSNQRKIMISGMHSVSRLLREIYMLICDEFRLRPHTWRRMSSLSSLTMESRTGELDKSGEM